MKDSKFNQQQAMPNTGANNNTGIIDLNVEGVFDNKFRKAFVQVDVPALSDMTNTSVTDTITLQTSADSNVSNFANTNPLVQIQIVGVANGTPKTTYKVPLPPNVSRFIRFNQNVPANGGNGANGVVNYDLVV